MQFSHRTTQILHEEHRATMAMIEDLETFIGRAGRRAPGVDDPAVRTVLQKIATAIDGEVSDHFAFEENELFTRLSEAGDTDICDHLSEEHRAILPLGQEVVDRARVALADGFDDQSWGEFRTPAGELIERLQAHIQKEEMALLPMVEELLDAETDFALSEAYGSAS
ncbi:MAG: hemerythrin domain-containing protein [Hyphomicrobiales bacterium]|nr:hemerythrin domain-containing protein [Hyphomicrobiales bacterium]MCP4998865.1 hemerythrin domain-containing protein [Hyphomicrobiales bacterium]